MEYDLLLQSRNSWWLIGAAILLCPFLREGAWLIRDWLSGERARRGAERRHWEQNVKAHSSEEAEHQRSCRRSFIFAVSVAVGEGIIIATVFICWALRSVEPTAIFLCLIAACFIMALAAFLVIVTTPE